MPTLTPTSEAELQHLADTAPEPARSLAAELLHVRRRVVGSALLGYYDEQNAREAWLPYLAQSRAAPGVTRRQKRDRRGKQDSHVRE